MTKRLLAALSLLCATASHAQALAPGDLMFTAYNADEDGWTLVALAELAPNSIIFFTENEFSAGAFNTGESFHRWDTGAAAIAAGTVVRFSNTDNATTLASSVGTFARGGISGSSNYALSQTGDSIYVYTGLSATMPSIFITAISSAAFSDTEGSLVGTGLSAGVNAIQVTNGSDYAEYLGVRSAPLTASAYRDLLAQPANWNSQVDGSFASQAPNLTSFAVSAVPEPGGVVLAVIGLAVVATSRHWRGKPTAASQI